MLAINAVEPPRWRDKEPNMIYSEYGTTGIQVSAVGFGGMRFNDQTDVDQCASLIKAAYDSDINYFDTAPGYGKSEDLFGAAFKEMNKTRTEKPFWVATKSNKGDPSAIRRELETSLERMNLDHIDFYHMWYVLSPESYEARKAKGALKEFEKLKDEGLIKHICVSTHMEGSDIGSMLKDYPFAGVLLGYSIVNFAYRDAGIQSASELNRGVVIMNPLGGGTVGKHPELFEYAKSRDDETVVEAALRFLIDDPRITVALVGLSSKEQIKEAISAVDGYRPLPKGHVDRMRDVSTNNLNALCTSCGYCDNCPESINIPAMMESYNSIPLEKDKTQMLGKLRFHWDLNPEEVLSHECIECGQCETACTQKLPIIERLKAMRPDLEKFVAGNK